MKKLMAAALVLTVFISAFSVTASAAILDYEIESPYEEVVWTGEGAYDSYKAQLHVHTIASDGDVQLADVVEAHYLLDYDILAITDHAIVGRGWNVVPQTIPLFRLVKYERTQMADVIPVTEQRYAELQSGVGRNGRGMLDVKTGIEMNGAVPSNSHVNGFFGGYGQGLFGVDGDYETPVKGTEKLGGITFLDHIGNYTKAGMEDDPTISDLPEHVNKFAKIFVDYPSCVGMDINSGVDNHTLYDRRLYDNILQKTIPYGVVPWAFCFSDAHGVGQWDRAFTVHMMPSNTVENLRHSMENGTFFGVSRHARTELGKEFSGEGAYPMVTNVAIDEENDTVTLAGVNYNSVKWVSNGKVIASGETLSLREHSDEITCYVRAYLTGEGGICYTQPFTAIPRGTQLQKADIPETHDTSTFLRGLVTVLDYAIFKLNPLVWLFKHFALGL